MRNGGRGASLVVENSRLLPKTFSKSSGEQRFSKVHFNSVWFISSTVWYISVQY